MGRLRTWWREQRAALGTNVLGSLVAAGILGLGGVVFAGVQLFGGDGENGSGRDEPGQRTDTTTGPPEPPRDSDGDGVPDAQDDCDNEPGEERYDGCPDSDGDGVPDPEDECPNKYGDTASGCPPRPKPVACKGHSLPHTFSGEITSPDDIDTHRFCTGSGAGSIRAVLNFTGSPETACQVRAVLRGPEGDEITYSGGTTDARPARLDENVEAGSAYSIDVEDYGNICSTGYGPTTYELKVTEGGEL